MQLMDGLLYGQRHVNFPSLNRPGVPATGDLAKTHPQYLLRHREPYKRIGIDGRRLDGRLSAAVARPREATVKRNQTRCRRRRVADDIVVESLDNDRRPFAGATRC